MTQPADRMRAALDKATQRKTTPRQATQTVSPPARTGQAATKSARPTPTTTSRVEQALARAGQPISKRPRGRENYPVQKKFLLDRGRHRWLVHAAHDSGPGVGYVALLRGAIDRLDTHPDRLAALRQYIAAHDITGADRGQTITVNLTTAQSDWLRLAAHQTGPLGITQHQLVHGLIDWLAANPADLTAIRSTLPPPE